MCAAGLWNFKLQRLGTVRGRERTTKKGEREIVREREKARDKERERDGENWERERERAGERERLTVRQAALRSEAVMAATLVTPCIDLSAALL